MRFYKRRNGPSGSIKAGNLLASRAAIVFSRRPSLIHVVSLVIADLKIGS
jgi:hypothetical protein